MCFVLIPIKMLGGKKHKKLSQQIKLLAAILFSYQNTFYFIHFSNPTENWQLLKTTHQWKGEWCVPTASSNLWIGTEKHIL